MSFVLPGDPAVKDPTKASYAAAVNDALADLNARLSVVEGNLLPNGSFEFDLDSDGEPDVWTVTDLSGGSHAIDSVVFRHGAKSLNIVTTGTGGRAEALADTFISCGQRNVVLLTGFVNRDTANIRLRMQVLYYNAAETLIATDTRYDDSGATTGWQLIVKTSEVPSGAYFYKIKLIGGESGGGTVAGNTYFDGIASTLSYRAAWAVGEYLLDQSPGAVTTTVAISKKAEMKLGHSGTLRIIFTLSNAIGSGTGRIYRNGVAIGTLRSVVGTTTTFSQDIVGWDKDDTVELWIGASSSTTTGSKFGLFINEPLDSGRNTTLDPL